MRILLLSHYFPPEVNAPATREHAHAAEWAAAGHEVTVVTCRPNCPTGVVFGGYRNRWRRDVETVDGVRVVRVWTYLAANAGFAKRIANYLSFMLTASLTSLRERRPDVVVATSPQFFNGWAGVIVSWLKWRPLVLEIRDIWPESIEAVGAMRKGPAYRALEWLERRMYRAATRIVTVGDGYRVNIESKITPRRPIEVVTNGVDAAAFTPRPADEELLAEFGLAGKFVCSYVGTIGMAHGLDVVVRAAKLLKDAGRDDVRFLLVGDGAERESLEALAAGQGVTDAVVLAGWQPKGRIAAVLASSDCCLVHLRPSELFGTVIPSKIFETMAMERPIVMGVPGQAAEIVAAAGAGVPMRPGSAEDLVSAIEALSAQPEEAAAMGRRGRAYVAEHFDRSALARRMLGVLESAANGAS